MESSATIIGSMATAGTEPIRTTSAMKFKNDTSPVEAVGWGDLLPARAEALEDAGWVGDFRLMLFLTRIGFPSYGRQKYVNYNG